MGSKCVVDATVVDNKTEPLVSQTTDGREEHILAERESFEVRLFFETAQHIWESAEYN